MKHILLQELKAKGAFTKELPKILNDIVSINYFNIPYRMKALIATSELMSFASQFKRNVILPDSTAVPINSISFCIAASGGHKDSSLRLTRKVFSPAYELISAEREKYAIKAAVAMAKESGESDYTSEQVYKDFYEKPVALFLKEVTPQGLIQYFNDNNKYPIGAGLMVNSEISDEFNTNGNFPDVIKILSEGYDLGIIEASYTKGKEFRNDGVSGVPFSALFIGSHYMLMYTPALKAKVTASLMSKLSRRCSFAYVPDAIEEPVYTSGAELIKVEKETREKAATAVASLVPIFTDITTHTLELANTPIELSPEVDTLAIMLKRLDLEISNTDCVAESADALYRKNRYWRAIKLAGAIALLDKSNVITESHFIDAINITELFIKDMELFETDLNKAEHERMADFIKSLLQPDGKAFISIHELKKRGFVTTTTLNKVKEMCALANAYDNSGIYTPIQENLSIKYEAIHKTDTINVSVKQIDNSKLFNAIATNQPADTIRDIKSLIATSATYGFKQEQATFADLSQLLQGNFAYSPFHFKDGVRGKSNIVGGTKWVVLDIDSSSITAEEAHFMLSDINHHIALGSDASNPFKFRVLLELDSVVEVEPIVWRNFYLRIAEDLALTVDPLPQSQIFFSYWEDSRPPILSVTDAAPIAVRDYLMQAHEASGTAQSVAAKSLTDAQKRNLIADELSTFAPAFNAADGEGSRKLIWAAKYAYNDLGMSKDDVIALVNRINAYWLYPMDSERLKITVVNQLLRW